MSARRHAVLAGVAAVLAVVLWWLSRDIVTVEPPVIDPPVEGTIQRTRTEPWLLALATLSAGVAMVLVTVAILRARPRTDH